jgi:hypothetical protein
MRHYINAVIVALALSLSACPVPGPVSPVGPDATDAAPTPLGDALSPALSCATPGDGPACACDILAQAKCREGQPTALGETCTAGSRHRLTVVYAADEEQRSISCIVSAGTVERLRSACGVCK